jgi:hypothetical protein
MHECECITFLSVTLEKSFMLGPNWHAEVHAQKAAEHISALRNSLQQFPLYQSSHVVSAFSGGDTYEWWDIHYFAIDKDRDNDYRVHCANPSLRREATQLFLHFGFWKGIRICDVTLSISPTFKNAGMESRLLACAEDFAKARDYTLMTCRDEPFAIGYEKASEELINQYPLAQFGLVKKL